MNNLYRILFSPGEVYATMKEDLNSVPPLMTLLLLVAVFTAAQSLFVSDEAIMNQAEEAVAASTNFFERIVGSFLPPEASEAFQETMDEQSSQMNQMMDEMLTPEQLQSDRIIGAFFAPISALIWLGLGVLILTTYFSIAGSSRANRRPWSEWMGFTLWSMLPVVLYYFCYLVATMLTGEVHPKHFLAPLAWIPGLEENAFAVNLTFGMIWAMWIQTVGMHRWGDRPLPVCLVIVLIPWMLQWLIAAGMVESVKAF